MKTLTYTGSNGSTRLSLRHGEKKLVLESGVPTEVSNELATHVQSVAERDGYEIDVADVEGD